MVFVNKYKELKKDVEEMKIYSIGLSNFDKRLKKITIFFSNWMFSWLNQDDLGKKF